MNIHRTNASSCNQNPHFMSRTISFKDEKRIVFFWDRLYGSIDEYPVSLNFLLAAHKSSNRSPFSVKQIDKLINMIEDDKDVILSAKEGNFFEKRVKEVRKKLKEKANKFHLSTKRNPNEALYNWLKKHIKKASPVSYLDFKKAVKLITKIEAEKVSKIKKIRKNLV